MKSKVYYLGVLFQLFSLVLPTVSCKSENQDTSTLATGTETNWLKACDRDAQCGTLSCECGVCTQRCSDDNPCKLEAAVCSKAGGAALRVLCDPENATSSLCLPECRETCSSGLVCVAGTCIPEQESTDGSTQEMSMHVDANTLGTTSGNASESTESNDASSSVGPNEDASASDSDPNPTGDIDGSVATTTSELSTTSIETISDAAASQEAGAGCPLDTRPLMDGCCYEDTDCPDGQACYQAACSGDVMAPGRCGVPPAAPSCYSERDCNADEECQDGHLASCGTLGPDTLGTCVAACDFDSCHPERCDEVGEPCCDPYPGDGPNYCNADLQCAGTGCELRAETTTPEAQERQLCQSTGGAWDYSSCGHYVCGQPPSCDAIVPGCNCGDGRSFGTLGCFDDTECTTL